jgi:hypothetical protein
VLQIPDIISKTGTSIKNSSRESIENLHLWSYEKIKNFLSLVFVAVHDDA